MTLVPNILPNSKASLRLALIGDAPGAIEEQFGTPFAGASGELLRSLLARAGIDSNECYFGNICQVRPPNDDI